MFLLYLSITGVFLSVLLIYFNGRKYPSSVYLGLFFLLVSLYAFIQYSLLYAHSVVLVAIVFIHFASPTYLIGPALYLYIRSILRDNSTLTKKDFWHLVPMIIYIGMVVPYFLMPWSYKMEQATKLVSDFNNIIHIEFPPIFAYPFSQINFLSRPALALGYLIWSFLIFRKYVRQNADSGSFSGQRFMKIWIMLLFGSLFVLIFCQLAMIIQSFQEHTTFVFFTTNILQILSGTGLAVLLVSPFFFPQILYGLPRIPEKILQSNPREQNPVIVEQSSLVADKPEFESGYLRSIQLKVEACMEDLQPYLKEECNLAYFSKITLIPVHHLSYYFREIKKQPFNDFKNEWRIRHAKRLILEGKHAGLTLEAVGLLSGFSSRNTFFRAFKNFEGITPGEYASKQSKPKPQGFSDQGNISGDIHE